MIKINPMDTYTVEKYMKMIKKEVVIDKITEEMVHEKEKIINKRKTKYKDKIIQIDEFIKESNSFLNTRIKTDLEQLIGGNMKAILNIYDAYAKQFKNIIPERGRDFKKFSFEQKVMNYLLRDIFNYDKIVSKKDIAYEITLILDVQVCPYCNRTYTSTVIKEKNKIIRPDFDHYYAKTEYPIFALSLCNLIPSCKICNSKKGSNSFGYDTNMYPFEEGVEDKKVFTYELPEYTIKVLRKDKGEKYRRFLNNVEKLKIEEIYDGAHRNIVRNLIKRAESINEKMIDVLNERLETEILQDKNTLKSILGYTPKEEIKNVSLGKLKNDIIDTIFDENIS